MSNCRGDTMSELIEYRVYDEGYGLILLNRPEKHHAISTEMSKKLLEKIQLAKNSDIKFLVISAKGNDMFCAGGDLNDLHADLNSDEAFKRLYPMKECLYELMSFPVPTVCLLNGNALGGGCEIATACDFRIGKEGTKFGFIQSSIGIVPGWGGGVLLYEKVNSNFAYQWLVEGKVYDISFLERHGWIHRIVPDDHWDDMEKVLQPYINKSIEQMKILKAQFNKNISVLSLSADMNEEVRQSATLWGNPEHQRALKRIKK